MYNVCFEWKSNDLFGLTRTKIKCIDSNEENYVFFSGISFRDKINARIIFILMFTHYKAQEPLQLEELLTYNYILMNVHFLLSTNDVHSRHF